MVVIFAQETEVYSGISIWSSPSQIVMRSSVVWFNNLLAQLMVLDFCLVGLWGLVNNAGISTFGEVEFTSMDTYMEVAEVNLWGTVRTTKAFLPLIRRSKGEWQSS